MPAVVAARAEINLMAVAVKVEINLAAVVKESIKATHRADKNPAAMPLAPVGEAEFMRLRSPHRVNPLNPEFSLQVRLWKQLPLSVANRIGPLIARGLG